MTHEPIVVLASGYTALRAVLDTLLSLEASGYTIDVDEHDYVSVTPPCHSDCYFVLASNAADVRALLSAAAMH